MSPEILFDETVILLFFIALSVIAMPTIIYLNDKLLVLQKLWFKDEEILFLPDDNKLCRQNLSYLLRVNNRNCRYLTNCKYNHINLEEYEKNSILAKMYYLFFKATKTIDMCIYSISHEQFADLLVFLRKRVKIRIITNNNFEEGHNAKDQVPRLSREGIEVKVRPNRVTEGGIQGYMHTKFFIIDSRIVINGSANMTRGGYELNDEVITKTQRQAQVSKYSEYFNQLWAKYDRR